MHTYEYEYTDTFSGEANYCWVKRGKVHVPDLLHYGYTGSTDGTYSKADKAQRRQLMTLVKREIGLTGVRGTVEGWGDTITFRPYGMATILFITFSEEGS